MYGVWQLWTSWKVVQVNNVYKRQRTRDCASTECAGDPVEEEPCTGTLCAGIKHISIEPQLNAFKLFFIQIYLHRVLVIILEKLEC